MSNTLINTITDTQNSLKLAETKLNQYEYVIDRYLEALDRNIYLATFSEAVVIEECSSLLKSILKANLKD
jgi:hypothetical protein